MTKTELIQAIAERAQLDKKQAASALTAFTEIVTETLQGKGNIALVGFGTFSVTERAARTGRNPKTGEEIQIAKATKAKFKVGKALDNAVKGVKSEAQSNNVEDKIVKAAAVPAKSKKVDSK